MKAALTGPTGNEEAESQQFCTNLWKKIESTLFPNMSQEQALDVYRQTVANDWSAEGAEAFRSIKYIVDREIEGCPSAAQLKALFLHGPWNMIHISGIGNELHRLNEYTNTVSYIFYKALEKLQTMGQEGEDAIRIIFTRCTIKHATTIF